jgi:4-amino-4-deoxychorismate lyase
MGFRYVLAPDGRVDAADRGLAYGDGVFETMAVRDGQIERLDLHFDRLRWGAERLRLPCPERPTLEHELNRACTAVRRGALKLILTRGSGPRGYAPPPDPEPTIILSVSHRDAPIPTDIAVVTLGQRLAESESLAGIKHLCRLEQVLGQLELGSCDADEGLMLSTSGNVIGGTSRNLFALLGRRLVTPAVRRAGIRGVMRQAVLGRSAALGIEIAEADLLPADLSNAGELFMTNALVGIQSVSRLDRMPYPSREIANRMRQALGLDRDD